MDEHGYFSLGLAADYTMAAISRARVVVLEVNPNVPFHATATAWCTCRR
jgi:acyl-CoA hydrolase